MPAHSLSATRQAGTAPELQELPEAPRRVYMEASWSAISKASSTTDIISRNV